MADLPCDNHPDTRAGLLITALDGSATLTLCLDCTELWARGLVAAADQADDAIGEPAEPAEEAGQPEPAEPTPDPEVKRPQTTEAPAQPAEPDKQAPAQETTPAGH